MSRKRNKGVVSPLFNEAAKQAQAAAKMQKGMAGVAKVVSAYYSGLVETGLPKDVCERLSQEFQAEIIQMGLSKVERGKK